MPRLVLAQYNSKDDKLRVGETICFWKNLQELDCNFGDLIDGVPDNKEK